MSEDSRKYLYLTRSKLRNFDIDNRRHWYASADFPDELKRIARALAETGVDGESIKSLVGFGTEMMALTRNMTFSDWSLVRMWDGMGLSDSADSFFPKFDELVAEVVKTEASELTQQILREIDAGFAAPIQGLAKTLPDDFAQSRKSTPLPFKEPAIMNPKGGGPGGI